MNAQGPGGEGDVIDHFSDKAIDNYLGHFTTSFAGHDISGLRAYFNDSYEVDDARGEANFTPLMFDEFQKRRGYDLREYLPALLGLDNAEYNQRVLSDYRETISDLILEKYTQRWHDWAAKGGKIIRNQAHGAPANILDLYAAADIPETEGEDIVKVKTASSVAHVMGKRLASSESATWLKDHFEASLSDVKQAIDLVFTCRNQPCFLPRNNLFAARRFVAGLDVLCGCKFCSKQYLLERLWNIKYIHCPLAIVSSGRKNRQRHFTLLSNF